jgi:protein-S-isoprenylcysteine O-methyltransferase Ste14
LAVALELALARCDGSFYVSLRSMTELPLPFRAAWMVLLVIWVAAAFWTRRTVSSQSLGGRVRHMLPIAAGAWLIFGHPLGTAFAGPLYAPAPWLTDLCLAITIAGLAFAVWARFVLGRQWSGRITLKADHALIQSGPYAWTRHPIYTGILLALLGSALARNDIGALLGLGIVAAGITVKALQEEALLESQFGAAYAAYRRRVRRLVPFVW